jgi:hypothetical protein
MLRIIAGEVKHNDFSTDSIAAAALARGILDRELLHRAYAFRGRFISLPSAMQYEEAEPAQNMLWGRIVKDLSGLKARYDLGVEIYDLAVRCSEVLSVGADGAGWIRCLELLKTIGPEQIIVDLPGSKTERISILARYPNGAIRLPEFSFNPQKWADAYELQKRTGYVFCPRDVAPIIGLASKIVFLVRFGVAMMEEADGYIKAGPTSSTWIKPLLAASIIDQDVADRLTSKRQSLISIRAEDLKISQTWQNDDLDLATRLSVQLQKFLQGGLTAEHLSALGNVLESMYRFVDMWFASNRPTSDLESEDALQNLLRDALIMRSLSVEEGSKIGGGKLDLYVEDAIMIENKFHSTASQSEAVSPAAGMQGRRYAISLGAQIVIVVAAYKPQPGQYQNKANCISINEISREDKNRAEIRFLLPFGSCCTFPRKTKKSREIARQVKICASAP